MKRGYLLYNTYTQWKEVTQTKALEIDMIKGQYKLQGSTLNSNPLQLNSAQYKGTLFQGPPPILHNWRVLKGNHT